MPRFRPWILVTGGVVLLLMIGWGRARWSLFPASASVTTPASGRVTAQATGAGAAHVSAPPLPDRGGSETAREARLLADVAALASTFDRLRAQPDDIERFRRSAEIENEFMALLDPETASLLIRRMPPGFADTHFGALALAKWAAAERGVAAAWMAAHPAASATAGEALARGWFAENRATLAAHLDQLPAGPWKTQLAITAGEDAFLAHEPGAVIGLLDRADAGDARRLRLSEWTATAWARQDVEAASVWAAREPQPERREALLAAVAVGQANVDPAAAAVRLLRTVTRPEALGPALSAVASVWATHDAEAANRWVATLPEGLLREKAEDGLLAVAAH